MTASAGGGPQVFVSVDAVDLSEFNRLNVIDADVGRLRPGEAGAAVELQRYLGGKLARITAGMRGDFVVASGVHAGKTIDFMLTSNNLRRVEKINQFFLRNALGFAHQLDFHLSKADIVAIDTRSLAELNQTLLMCMIGMRARNLQSKIILMR